MSQASTLPPGATEADDSALVLAHRPLVSESDIDITPMIDLTFLLLIFFLVSSTPADPERVIELPKAATATAVRPADSVILSLADAGEKMPAAVYFADGKVGQPLAGDWKEQEEAIRQYVERGVVAERKRYVLVKAEKGVRHREVARVARAVALVEGAELHVAVMESDE
jgi:biopolymer transport protein ExbD